MRLRWGRISGAGVVLGTAAPMATMLALWATGPAPEPMDRRFEGTDRCRDDEVLMAAGDLHDPRHAPDTTGGPEDALAAQALLAATRCDRIGHIPALYSWKPFTATQDGVAWIARNERDAVGVDHLLDVWELAADHARQESVYGTIIWDAIAFRAADALDELLADPDVRLPAHERAAARERLLALASVVPDWDATAALEEQDLWRMAASALREPSAWLELAQFPHLVLQTRAQGMHDDLAAEHQRVRRDALLLVAALDLYDRCEEPADALAEASARGVQLTWHEARCAVTGVAEYSWGVAEVDVRVVTGR